MSIKDFRLTEETAFLFVLSYEYGLSFVTLLKLYELSVTLFWGYIAALTPALKMSVRKGSQLSKTSQRLYKSFLGLKERKQEKVEKLVETEDGEIVLDKKGNPKKEKITVNRYEPIILTDEEKNMRDLMCYCTTRGYSNGERFYTETEVMRLKTSKALKYDVIEIGDENFLKCTLLEHFIETCMPDIDISDFNRMSLKDLHNKITTMTRIGGAVEA